jgi:AraC family transcriptional regulator, ethanolamine operon transcriptional activator
MVTNTFHDFESFAASLRNVDLRMMLTYDRGQRWQTQQAKLNRLAIQYGLEGGGIICEGSTEMSYVGFFVPMKNPEAVACNGTVCNDHCWMLQVPGREFHFNVTGPNEWATVFIPLDVWEVMSADLHHLPGNHMIQSSPSLVASYRDLIRRYLSIDHSHSRFLEIPSIQQAMEEEILALIAAMLKLEQGRSTVRSGRPTISRDQVMHRAMSWLEDHPNFRVSTSALAAVTGVSERTLRSIFREFYGVGPLRYLKLRQLHSMRRTLKRVDPEKTSLSDVATEFGIWELGRFARDYRTLFGESPTDTLRTGVANKRAS